METTLHLRKPWRRPASLLIGAAAALLACDGGGGSTQSVEGLDASTDPDMRREAGIWDMLYEAGHIFPSEDFGPGREDMRPPATCLKAGAMFQAQAVGDPIPGLIDVRADVDADGDSKPDLVLTLETDAKSELRFLSGLDGTELGNFAAGMGRHLSIVSPSWPKPDLIGPTDDAGQSVFWVLDRGTPTSALRALSAASYEQLRFIELPGDAAEVILVPGGQGGLALVNLADGACAEVDLGAPEAPTMGNGCRVSPAWDVNGDTLNDVLVTAAGGATLLDAATLEPIGQILGGNLVVGFFPLTLAAGGPMAGPADVRGRGPEIAAAQLDRGTLLMTFHDPVSLMQTDELPAIDADFLQARFWPSRVGLRLVAEGSRQAVHLLNIYELEGLQARNDSDPYVNLEWTGGVDINDDDHEDIVVRTGPRPDWVNGSTIIRDAADGQPLLELPTEQSARFDMALQQRNGFGHLADVDGCEGNELIVIRGGIPQDTGLRSSRLQAYEPGGRRVYQSDSETLRRHIALVVDLNAAPPAEIVELRVDGANAGRLTVYRAP